MFFNGYLLKEYNYNDIDVIYSITVQVYNQEDIIEKNIKSIIEFTLGNFELIIILDFCFDNTEKILLNLFDNYKNNKPNFSGVKIFKQEEYPIFEASSDNVGFKNSKGRFCLEIQSDMEMNQKGYNLHLSKPFNMLDNIIAVGGRLCCAVSQCPPNIKYNDVIQLMPDLNSSKINNIDINCFYVYDTIARGPILFDKKKLIELDYIDEKKFYQENSDHELMIRAYLNKKYICGYVPITFKAPIKDGTGRKDVSGYYLKMNKEKQLINNKQKIIRGNWFGNGKIKDVDNWKSKKLLKYDITNISYII